MQFMKTPNGSLFIGPVCKRDIVVGGA